MERAEPGPSPFDLRVMDPLHEVLSVTALSCSPALVSTGKPFRPPCCGPCVVVFTSPIAQEEPPVWFPF